jgi:hypothetical protein
MLPDVFEVILVVALANGLTITLALILYFIARLKEWL